MYAGSDFGGSMKFPNRISVYGLCAVVGGLATALVFSVMQRRAPAAIPLSPVLCFLNKDHQASPFAQFDGQLFSRENLPPDMYSSFLAIEADNRLRLTELAKRMAVRVDDQKAQMRADGKSVKPDTANTKAESSLKKITIEDARVYFEQNKASFPNVAFSKVEKLIVDMLQQRENSLHLSSKIGQFEKENRFHMLHPTPCGGKITAPYSNQLPARGNTTADLQLLYVFSYDCSQCRLSTDELMDVVNQNLASMRLWLLPVAGREGTRNFAFSSAFQCVYDLEPSQIMNFNKILMAAPMTGSEKDVTESVLSEAKAAGINAEKVASCMKGKQVRERLEQYQKFAELYGMDGSNPRYFLNERGMDPNIGSDIVNMMRLIFSERDRLKNYL